MLTALTNLASGLLGRTRFSLTMLAPPTLLGLLVAFLLASGAYTNREASPRSGLLVVYHDPGWAALTVVGIFLLVLLARPFQVALIQFLEGYWDRGRVPRLAAEIATEQHRRRLDSAHVRQTRTESPPAASKSLGDTMEAAHALKQSERLKMRAERIITAYPAKLEHLAASAADDRLMPTMLGNILRAGEDKAGGRYGLEMSVVYPRMYPAVAAGKLADPIRQQLELIASSASMCVAAAVGVVVGSPLLAMWNWWSIMPVASALVAVAAYRGALRAAAWHATLLAAAFDLHRFDLYPALHLQLPKTPEQEFKLNEQLSWFFRTGDAFKETGVIGRRSYVHPGENQLRPSETLPPKP